MVSTKIKSTLKTLLYLPFLLISFINDAYAYGNDYGGSFLIFIVLIMLFDAIIFAMLCSYLAKTKGRDSSSWAIIGFLLGPIGLLAIGFTPKLEDGHNGIGQTSGHTTGKVRHKKCPSCAESIKIEANKCKICGETFTPEDIRKSIEEAANLEYQLKQQKSGYHQCPNCDRFEVYTVSDGVRGSSFWCPVCNNYVDVSGTDTEKQRQWLKSVFDRVTNAHHVPAEVKKSIYGRIATETYHELKTTVENDVRNISSDYIQTTDKIKLDKIIKTLVNYKNPKAIIERFNNQSKDIYTKNDYKTILINLKPHRKIINYIHLWRYASLVATTSGLLVFCITYYYESRWIEQFNSSKLVGDLLAENQAYRESEQNYNEALVYGNRIILPLDRKREVQSSMHEIRSLISQEDFKKGLEGYKKIDDRWVNNDHYHLAKKINDILDDAKKYVDLGNFERGYILYNDAIQLIKANLSIRTYFDLDTINNDFALVEFKKIKSKGDLAYSKGEYREAIDAYETCKNVTKSYQISNLDGILDIDFLINRSEESLRTKEITQIREWLQKAQININEKRYAESVVLLDKITKVISKSLFSKEDIYVDYMKQANSLFSNASFQVEAEDNKRKEEALRVMRDTNRKEQVKQATSSEADRLHRLISSAERDLGNYEYHSASINCNTALGILRSSRSINGSDSRRMEQQISFIQERIRLGRQMRPW